MKHPFGDLLSSALVDELADMDSSPAVQALIARDPEGVLAYFVGSAKVMVARRQVPIGAEK